MHKIKPKACWSKFAMDPLAERTYNHTNVKKEAISRLNTHPILPGQEPRAPH